MHQMPRDRLLTHPRRVLARDIRQGDTIEVWYPWELAGIWRQAWTATARSNTNDRYHRWTTAQGELAHLQHLGPVQEGDFRADHDDEGNSEILLRKEKP